MGTYMLIENFFKDISDSIHSYQTLKQLQKESQQIQCKNFTFFHVFSAIHHNSNVGRLYKKCLELQNFTVEQKNWILQGIFDVADAKSIDEQKFYLLNEKVLFIQKCSTLWEKNFSLLDKIRGNFSDVFYREFLLDLRHHTITEKELEQLHDFNFLEYFKRGELRSDNLVSLLKMTEENRTFYLKEGDEILHAIPLRNHQEIGQIKPLYFKEFLELLKKRYSSYAFLDFGWLLAKQYGQDENEQLVKFVFSAFPFNLPVKELSSGFFDFVNTIMKENRQEDLDTIATRYYHFLKQILKKEHYKTIIDDRFLRNPNKELLLDLLQEVKGASYYQKKQNVLLKLECKIPKEFKNYFQEFLEVDDLNELKQRVSLLNLISTEQLSMNEQQSIYQFTSETKNLELIESRIKLMIYPGFFQSPYQPKVLQRMQNVVTKEDADKIVDGVSVICDSKTSALEKEKLLESLPGKEHTLKQDDLEISLFNLESIDEEKLTEGLEIEKGALKLVVRRKGLVKKGKD